jgi:hypothetical protein
MATAILRYDLSDADDEREHRYALAGREALIALEGIREAIRQRLKYGEIGAEARQELEAIREQLPHELIELLV